jgi:hypothetical protein
MQYIRMVRNGLKSLLALVFFLGFGLLQAQIYIPQTPVKPGPEKDQTKQPMGSPIPGDRTRPNAAKERRTTSRKESLSTGAAPASTFGERTQGYMGFSLEFIPIRQGALSVFPATPIIFGISGGAYHNIKQWNDMFGLGLDLSTTLTFSYSSFSGLTFYNRTPLYFVARVGARTTKYNSSRVGAMLGVGGAFNYLVLPYAVNVVNNQIFRYEQAYFAPAAMFEVTVNQSNGNVWALRLQANLTAYTQRDFQPQGVTGSSDVTYQNFGVGIIYYF